MENNENKNNQSGAEQPKVETENNNKKMSTGKKILIGVVGAIVLAGAALGITVVKNRRAKRAE